MDKTRRLEVIRNVRRQQEAINRLIDTSVQLMAHPNADPEHIAQVRTILIDLAKRITEVNKKLEERGIVTPLTREPVRLTLYRGGKS